MTPNAKEKIKLLYIGNHSTIIDTLKEKYDKVEVIEMDNGLRGIDYLRKHKDIDVVISDYKLSGIQRDSLATYIKTKLGLSGIPFILFAFGADVQFRNNILKKKSVVDDLYLSPPTAENLLIRIHFLIYYLNKVKEARLSGIKSQNDYKIPVIKRLFDILASGIALLVLSPPLLMVALAIRMESKGSVIYKSKRVGTGYKIFNFLKFRSMYTGSDAKLKELEHLNQYSQSDREVSDTNEIPPCPKCAKLPDGEYCSPILYIKGEKICEYWYNELKKKDKAATFIKIENDPRITKVGKFIRNTSIDELPQLINVLKGDMSIVGNRPLPLYEAEQLTSDDWSARFLAPAGITGLWQVELRGKGGVMSEDERKGLDNKYAYNYSLWGDIKLIMRTIPALFQKENV